MSNRLELTDATWRRVSPKLVWVELVGGAIVTLLFVATLRLGREVVLPVVIALLLTLMLTAPVRWLQKFRIPGRVDAALVVFGVLYCDAATLIV